MLNKIKRLFVDDLGEPHPGSFAIVMLVVVTVIGVVMLAYCGASSKVNVPKADQYAANSNASQVQSVQAETDANNISNQSQAVEAKRQTAKGEYEAAKVSDRNAENKLNQRKVEYEKAKNAKPVVNADDLDGRERGLLTELRKLYWQQPK